MGALLAASAMAAENSAPTLAVPDRVQGRPNLPVSAAVQVGDPETPAEDLNLTLELVSGVRSNGNLLVASSVTIEGAGADRVLKLTPGFEQYGFTFLRLTVTDTAGASTSRQVEYRVEPFEPAHRLDFPPGEQAAWADVDADGRLDWLWESTWFRNLPDGSFAAAGMVPLRIQAGAPLAIGDPDGNGLPDFAFIGTEGNLPRTLLLTNAPSTVLPQHRFRPLAADLVPDHFDSAISWADYDLDGDSDLFALGSTSRRSDGRYASSLWRNDGGLSLVAVPSPLPPLLFGAMAWTDYDGDGDADVLVLGSASTGANSGLTQLLFNDGKGGFASVPLNLPQVLRGQAAWADFDLDGRPDLFLGGAQAEGRAVIQRTRILRHLPDGTLGDAVELPPLLVSDVAVADFNNDGLPDLLCRGAPPSGLLPVTRLFINRGAWRFEEIALSERDIDSPFLPPFMMADVDGDGIPDLGSHLQFARGTASRTNRLPEAPTGLQALREGEDVVLSWQAASDGNQAGGLTYNVRVGTTPGGTEILSPLSLPDGTRLVAEPGNAFHGLRRRLRQLPAGQYRWTVQAVDNSWAGGAFASEGLFVVGDGEQVRIDSITPDGGQVALAITARPAGLIILEHSPDLARWEPASTNEMPAQAVLKLTVGMVDAQYWRVRRAP